MEKHNITNSLSIWNRATGKKSLVLLALSLAAVLGGYGQTKKGHLAVGPCKGCLAGNSAPCTPPDTINLQYDSCAKAISKPQYDGLVSGKSYYFRICNLNNALYSTKTLASNITRVAALAPSLSQLNGYLSTAKTDNVSHLNIAYAKSDYPSEIEHYYFIQRYKFDYEMMAKTVNETKKLLDSLVKNKPIDPLIQQAKNVLNILAHMDTALRVQIILGAPKLPQHLADSLFKKAVDAKNAEEAEFVRFADHDLYKQDTLKAFVNSLFSDFNSRVAVILSPEDSKRPFADDKAYQELLAAKTAIKNDSAFLSKAPDYIFAVLNSKCCIVTGPNRITSDYLQLNITLLKSKFTDKPDTVSFNKINFYRYHYWKWLDASVGFFYDNLASMAYYFKNGIPAAELNSRADISIGALAHSYWVFETWLKAGPCAGIGVSALDGKSKYFFGGSVIFGKSNEWALSGGYALASLPKISNLYQTSNYTSGTTSTVTTNGTTNTNTTGTTPSTTTSTTSSTTTTVTTTTSPNGTNGAVNTFNKLQGGVFIGISYSFLKL